LQRDQGENYGNCEKTSGKKSCSEKSPGSEKSTGQESPS
jgi:hypothetical protein